MVSAAYVTFRKKLLLILRDKNSKLKDPDCWDIIGGKMDEDETYEVAIRRELEEELNIVPETVKYLFLTNDAWDEKTSLFHVVLTKKEVEAIRIGHEGQKLEYFSFDDLQRIKLTKNLSQYLETKPSEIQSLLKS